MRKIVATVAAGLMIAGGAVLSAPAATAYPAGADPTVRIIGSAGLNPGDAGAPRPSTSRPAAGDDEDHAFGQQRRDRRAHAHRRR